MPIAFWKHQMRMTRQKPDATQRSLSSSRRFRKVRSVSWRCCWRRTSSSCSTCQVCNSSNVIPCDTKILLEYFIDLYSLSVDTWPEQKYCWKNKAIEDDWVDQRWPDTFAKTQSKGRRNLGNLHIRRSRHRSRSHRVHQRNKADPIVSVTVQARLVVLVAHVQSDPL